jgi:polyphosphate kinase
MRPLASAKSTMSETRGTNGNGHIASQLDDPQLYINREISWLAFNARVLAESRDARWPLLERLKFLAIHGSNLDEFFMIRVSGLHEQLEATVTEATPDRLSPKEQLVAIRQLVLAQVKEVTTTLASELLPALSAHGIRIEDWEQLDADTRRLASAYFRRAVYPVLTPLAVDPGHPFPFLSNLSLSLAVEVRDPVTEERKFARVKVPEILPRFVPLDGSLLSGDAPPASIAPGASMAPPSDVPRRFLPLEQLIAAHLDQLFPGMEIIAQYPFRVTRDMDVEILEDEAHDLLAAVDREIRQRRFGACVRLEVLHGIPERIRQFLVEKLEIDGDDVYESPGLLGLSALMSLALINRSDLRDPPFSAKTPPELGEGSDIFAAIRNGDILLHHPYDSFLPVIDFLNRAADDPHVLAIKMTLYRAGSNAEALRALVRAAENGKQVAVSIEIKARFDEEANIGWARKLERVGAHVFYGTAGMKTHAKAALVVRREGDKLVRYAHLSTGNYNASTARLYTDLGVLTANVEIGEDVSELFNSLSGFARARYRRIAVAPHGLLSAILAKIGEQTERARAGKPARIFAKLNSLVDMRVIQALYHASTAGVPVNLVVRGVCCLRPGVPGLSENIQVFSVIGRFLEHERVYVFGPAGEEEFFLSSADWMPRNLDRRVEVLFPIESEKLRDQIRREVLAPVLSESSRVYVMDAEGNYQRRKPAPGQAEVGVQESVLEWVGHGRVAGGSSSGHPPRTATITNENGAPASEST